MDNSDNKNQDHPEEPQKTNNLARSFTFWYSYAQNKGKLTREDYESENKILGTFSTVEGFWSYYQHMIHPESLPVSSKFALFQEGIKPAWEDKENQGGGSFILKVKRNYSNKFWEDLVLSFVGDQCDDNDQICGIILNVKETEANVSIWTRSLDVETRGLIEEWVKKTLGFGEKMTVQYRHHPRNKEEPVAQPVAHASAYRRIERNDETKKKELEAAG